MQLVRPEIGVAGALLTGWLALIDNCNKDAANGVAIMDRGQWAAAVDEEMCSDWCISMGDAGTDKPQLADIWLVGQTRKVFVGWFSEKYDPTPFKRSRCLSSIPGNVNA